MWWTISIIGIVALTVMIFALAKGSSYWSRWEEQHDTRYREDSDPVG